MRLLFILIVMFVTFIPKIFSFEVISSIEFKEVSNSFIEYEKISLPKKEIDVLRLIAEKYNLDPIQTLLLFVIRKHEDGAPGKELGVLYIKKDGRVIKFDNSGFNDGGVSLILQGEQAARIIKKIYRDGDLLRFANKYAPIGVSNDPNGLNKYWYPSVKKYMERWKKVQD